MVYLKIVISMRVISRRADFHYFVVAGQFGPAMLVHVEKLVEHFDKNSIALIQKIRRPGSQDDEYIFNMDALSDDILQPVLDSEATSLVKRMAEQKH